MDTSSFVILTTASAVNMALPGPGIILTFTRASCRGLTAGVGVSVGFLLSSFVLATAAVLAVAGLLNISRSVLESARWIGLGVILWIALQLVLVPGADAAAKPRQVTRGDLLAGFALGITSPFNVVFLLALLPQFTPARLTADSAGAMVLAYLIGQGLVLCAVSLLGAVVGCAAPVRTKACVVRRLAGATLAGFAVAAAAYPL